MDCGQATFPRLARSVFVAMAAPALAAFAISCSAVQRPIQTPSPEWGPLAVASRDLALLVVKSGPISIDDRCVTITQHGITSVIVWPPERTEWLASERIIRYTDTTGSVAEVAHGQRVRLGGGGDPGGPSGDIEWVSPPHAECADLRRWWVTTLEKDTGSSPSS